MNVIDTVIKMQHARGMTNQEVAADLPFSRQMYEKVMRRGDCKLSTMDTILNVFKVKLCVISYQSNTLPTYGDALLGEFRRADITVAQSEGILQVIGYELGLMEVSTDD